MSREPLTPAQREAKKAHGRTYYLKNRAKILAKNAEWKRQNPERWVDLQARYRAEHKEEARAYKIAWQATNADQLKSSRAARYQENREAVLIQQKEYLARNVGAITLRRAAGFQKHRVTRIAATKAWGRANPEKLAGYQRARVEALAPCYVAAQLGLPVAALPPELLELKREQVQYRRLAKQIKQKLKELNETVNTNIE